MTISPDIFLENLKCAIEEVPKDYYGLGERTYAYELYYRLRIILDSSKYSKNTILTGEIVKTTNDADGIQMWPDGSVADLKIDGSQKTQPDLTFHAPKSSDQQVAIIEIKLSECGYFARDLRKLSDYKKKFKFMLAIFVIVDSDLSKIAGMNLDGIDDEIVVIAKKDYCSKISETTISDLNHK